LPRDGVFFLSKANNKIFGVPPRINHGSEYSGSIRYLVCRQNARKIAGYLNNIMK